MLDIPALADRLGMSQSQTRRIVSALDSVLHPFINRGENNAILVDANGLAILERARDLKRQGVAYQQLADYINTEMEQPSTNGHETERETIDNRRETDCESCQMRERLIDYLEGELERERQRAERERDRADRLEQLALPGSRRGPLAWLGDLFRSNGHG